MMIRIKSSVLVLIGLGCAGCSSMSAQAECRATATDSCYTIEQVDDMTHYADDVIPIHRMTHQKRRSRASSGAPQGNVVLEQNGSPLWVADAAMGKSWA